MPNSASFSALYALTQLRLTPPYPALMNSFPFTDDLILSLRLLISVVKSKAALALDSHA
jgi:hypothetical protein